MEILNVLNSDNESIGYLIDEYFYNDYHIKAMIDNNDELVDNFILTSNGIESKTILKTSYYSDIRKKYDLEKLYSDNFIKRDIQKEFYAWKHNVNHLPMVLVGGALVGKSTEILKFAYENYEYVNYFDLSNDKLSFVDDIGSTIMEFCKISNIPYFKDDKRSILIFDIPYTKKEIYKYLSGIIESFKCDIVFVLNSLIYLNNYISLDNFQILKMSTLSFVEFLELFKVRELLCKSELDLKTLADLKYYYDIYIQVGGYPYIVSEYFLINDMNYVIASYYNLLIELETSFINYVYNNFNELYIQSNFKNSIKLITNTNSGKNPNMSKIGYYEINWMQRIGVIEKLNDFDYRLDSGLFNYLIMNAGLIAKRDFLLKKNFILINSNINILNGLKEFINMANFINFLIEEKV